MPLNKETKPNQCTPMLYIMIDIFTIIVVVNITTFWMIYSSLVLTVYEEVGIPFVLGTANQKMINHRKDKLVNNLNKPVHSY